MNCRDCGRPVPQPPMGRPPSRCPECRANPCKPGGRRIYPESRCKPDFLSDPDRARELEDRARLFPERPADRHRAALGIECKELRGAGIDTDFACHPPPATPPRLGLVHSPGGGRLFFSGGR